MIGLELHYWRHDDLVGEEGKGGGSGRGEGRGHGGKEEVGRGTLGVLLGALWRGCSSLFGPCMRDEREEEEVEEREETEKREKENERRKK
jgi:hypothetical protein